MEPRPPGFQCFFPPHISLMGVLVPYIVLVPTDSLVHTVVSVLLFVRMRKHETGVLSHAKVNAAQW